MNIENQINDFIASYPEPKRSDLLQLHQLLQQLIPQGKLWFLDGLNDEKKVVSNPNIGYGSLQMHYANGKTREFYQIGISPNSTGISVYLMGIEDKSLLNRTFSSRIGKASISGYCIKFKALKDIQLPVLEEAIRLAIS